LIRSLTDGDAFLGQFTIHGGPRRVALIDDELSEAQLYEWLGDQNIKNQAAVVDVASLRGRVSAFNILDERVRAMWAERLRQAACDVLVLDCLRPILDALGLDENRDAGKFLVPFDALLLEAGISEAFVVHHMGHNGERSRGDSRLQDWPDAIWRIVRETEEPDSTRYFSAYGRDVEVPEGRIDYDATSRRYTLAGGSRKQAQAAERRDEAKRALLGILAEYHLENGDDAEGLPVRTLIEEMTKRHNISNRRVYDALKDCGPRDENGDGSGQLANKPGPKKSVLWRIENPCAGCGLPVLDPVMSMHRECAE
jgi:hypothetical protein